jgi:hypothetical protein
LPRLKKINNGSKVSVTTTAAEDAIVAAPTPTRITLIGPVLTLTRKPPTEHSPQGGSAEIEFISDIDQQGSLKRIRARVSGRNHELAIIAYRSRLNLIISGFLVYDRSQQQWRLEGPIEVDENFMNSHLESMNDE